MTWQEAEQQRIQDFLDGMADLFDKGKTVSPDTLFEDSLTGYFFSADDMLRRIRLHDAMRNLCAKESA